MTRHSTFLAATVIVAAVFGGSTPAQAADGDAVKRAIVVTVLNNLGVQPTSELIDALVADIPIDVLDSGLVSQVGRALDRNGDASRIIGSTVDSNGDGVPDENGATDASAKNDEDDDDDESSGSSSGSNSGSSSSGGGTTTNPTNDDEEEEEDN